MARRSNVSTLLIFIIFGTLFLWFLYWIFLELELFSNYKNNLKNNYKNEISWALRP